MHVDMAAVWWLGGSITAPHVVKARSRGLLDLQDSTCTIRLAFDIAPFRQATEPHGATNAINSAQEL